MANKLYDETAIQDIADAIRSKNGSSDTYTVSEMSTAIENIPSGGGANEYFIIETTINMLIKNIKKTPVFYLATAAGLNNFFSGADMLEKIEGINAPSATSVAYMCSGCTNLKTFGQLITSNLRTCERTFYNCQKLKEAPAMNTSNCTIFLYTFYNCQELENVPVYDMSSFTNISYGQNMFSNCKKLTDTSIDNILQSCISAGTTGTLANLGFNYTVSTPARIQALPHYQDFVNAGWSIGY